MVEPHRQAVALLNAMEKSLEEQIQKGLVGAEGKTTIDVEGPADSIVATVRYLVAFLKAQVTDPERNVGVPRGVANAAEVTREPQEQEDLQCDFVDSIDSAGGLSPSRSLKVMSLSNSVTHARLTNWIAENIPTGFLSLVLKEGFYATKYAYVNFSSVVAACRAKQTVVRLMEAAVDNSDGEGQDLNIFRYESKVVFQPTLTLYVGILHMGLAKNSRLDAEGRKLDGFVRAELFNVSDSFCYSQWHFRTSEAAEVALVRLGFLKAKYEAEGTDSIFLPSTVFRFGTPKVNNPNGFKAVRVDQLRDGVSQAVLDTIVERKLEEVYSCIRVTQTGQSAVFHFATAEGAAWGFKKLSDLKKETHWIFTPESKVMWAV